MAAKGVSPAEFDTLAAAGHPPSEVLIDSTHFKAQRLAAGEKDGRAPKRFGVNGGSRNTKFYALINGQGRPLDSC